MNRGSFVSGLPWQQSMSLWTQTLMPAYPPLLQPLMLALSSVTPHWQLSLPHLTCHIPFLSSASRSLLVFQSWLRLTYQCFLSWGKSSREFRKAMKACRRYPWDFWKPRHLTEQCQSQAWLSVMIRDGQSFFVYHPLKYPSSWLCLALSMTGCTWDVIGEN